MIYLNLAPFKYNDILKAHNSPIEKINVIEIKNSDGSKYFEAHGWLKAKIKYKDTEKSNLYGSCDATGTDKYLQIAIWKCISELIERWAFNQLLITNSLEYGIDIDATSTGFAALPCWPNKSVRKIAYGEALERWAISNWWRNNLIACKDNNISLTNDIGLVKINIPKNVGYVVITYKKSNMKESSFYCYGFAYGEDIKKATLKASIEMHRNEKVLAAYNSSQLTSINDKRLVYFSTDEGFQHFISKVQQNIVSYVSPPDPIVDCEVIGDWSQFATVWRCLLPETTYNWSDEKHFMF